MLELSPLHGPEPVNILLQAPLAVMRPGKHLHSISSYTLHRSLKRECSKRLQCLGRASLGSLLFCPLFWSSHSSESKVLVPCTIGIISMYHAHCPYHSQCFEKKHVQGKMRSTRRWGTMFVGFNSLRVLNFHETLLFSMGGFAFAQQISKLIQHFGYRQWLYPRWCE